jgi:hypothetical protein
MGKKESNQKNKRVKSILRMIALFYFHSMLRIRTPERFIFLISHMRSGSSLLTHLLASNEDVNAYGETHIRYNCEKSFADSICKIRLNLRSFKGFQANKIYMDKILHNFLLIPENLKLFMDKNVKFIYLLRSPKDSMNSLINTFSMTNSKAYNYYKSRLCWIEKMILISINYPEKYFLNYEDLKNNTDKELKALTNYLNLNSCIKNSYTIFRTTGKRGVGDIGKNILKGKIVNTPTSKEYIGLSKDRQKNIEVLYQKTKSMLEKNCLTYHEFL